MLMKIRFMNWVTNCNFFFFFYRKFINWNLNFRNHLKHGFYLHWMNILFDARWHMSEMEKIKKIIAIDINETDFLSGVLAWLTWFSIFFYGLRYTLQFSSWTQFQFFFCFPFLLIFLLSPTKTKDCFTLKIVLIWSANCSGIINYKQRGYSQI